VSRLPPALIAGSILLLAIVLMSIAAPLLTPYHPDIAEPGAILQPPSWAHPAGTDSLGRDLFSRLLYGGRASLAVAFGVVAIGLSFGTLIGCASGLAGGWIDAAIMRIVDVLMSIPGLVVALALSAALGPSLLNLAYVLGGLSIPYYVRIFRGEALSLRERGFVRAARASGAGFSRLLLRHVLPNVAPTMATFGSTALGSALVAASAFSFLGLGAQPPQAEWGSLIYEGRNNIMYEWWCAILPGLLVSSAALGFILVGDGLRDLLDPKGSVE